MDRSRITRAEAALRQSDLIYRQIRDAVIATGLDGRVIFWSPGAERMYGYSSAEMMGRTLGILWPEDVDGEARQQALYRDLRQAGQLQIVVERRKKSGERIHVSILLGWLKDEQGEPCGIIGTSHEVTEMVRAQAALRQSEEQYRALIQDFPQGIIVYGQDRIEFANAACARLLGYEDVATLLALPSIDAILAPINRELLREQRRRRLAGEPAPGQYDAVLLRRDGSLVHVLSSSRLIQWAGRPAVQTTMMDITERKRSEDALREKEWFLSRAQKAGQIGTWFRPVGSDLVQWSEETYRISGVDPATFVPSLQANLELIHPEDRPAFLEFRRRVADLGQPVSSEYRLVRPDGQVRHVYMIGELLRDGSGAPIGAIGIIQDVTERKLAEAQALQTQKLEVVGRLAAGVAHDFNNLLTVIRGNLDLALRQCGADDPLRGLLSPVLAAADRGRGLVQQLSAFTRRQALRPEVLDVRRVLTELAGLLGHTLGGAVRVSTDISPDIWPARLDRVQFDNAILNLAINARDAMPYGGELAISAANAPLAGGEHGGPEPGDYVMICVSDTGTGIAPEIRGKIFDPFFTTKPVGKGTGLGLSMVMEFVRQSGGFIRLESELGRGTAMRLYLPRWAGEPAAPAPEPATSTGEEPPESGTTVLIVEDQPGVRALAERIFMVLGCTVLTAGTGREALEVLRSRPDVSVLFTDLMLPQGLNGAQVAREALRLRPGLAVILTTGFAEDAIGIADLMDQGALYVEKPYRVQEIRACLEQRRRIRPCGG